MIKNIFGHLRTILRHKRKVAHYCFMCGLYKQGIFHDMSKFSPVEFFESAKYYQGFRSPILACKEDKGYSLAWLHHKGKNKHHWEYWLDDFEKGTIPKKIPFKYVLEMICDFMAAGQVYKGKDFTFQVEYEWWLNKKKVILVHEDTMRLLTEIMDQMNQQGIEAVLKNKGYLKLLERNY